MLALYDFFWGLGTENQGLLIASAGGAQTQILGDSECGVVVTHTDGTSHFFPGYFSGVATSPAASSSSTSYPYDSGQGRALSLIPFDPTNPNTPRALSFPLRPGDQVQNTGSLPSVGVYTSSTISNALPSGVAVTVS